MITCDMFDSNGRDKLSDECVESREEIIKFHANNEKTVFFVSHSGGKDSQAMYDTVTRLVPKAHIVCVHANLGEIEHKGVVEHIESTINHPLHIVSNEKKDFIDMVLLRGMFPSAQFRQCTSDLKTSVIDKFIRKYMKENGFKVGFNCTGLRAEESNMRAKKNPLWINKRLTLKSNARTVFDWMPIFHLSTEEVFDTIYGCGQKPHPIYGERGEKNNRLSCVFCIMGCKNDLQNGAIERPELYHQVIALEKVVDHTMFAKTKQKTINGVKHREAVPVSLADKTGIDFDELQVRRDMKQLRERQRKLVALRDEEKAAKERAKKEKQTKRADTSTLDWLELM